MKRFFRFFAIAVVAMAIVGCDKQRIDGIEILTPTTAQDEIQQTIERLQSYDVEAVTELLCDKEWRRWSEARYNEDWSEICRLVLFNGMNMGYEGNTVDRFIFSTDGAYARLSAGSCGYKYNEYGTWEFDPETRHLKLNAMRYESDSIENIDEHEPREYSRHVIALSDKTFIWDTLEGNYRYEYAVVE